MVLNTDINYLQGVGPKRAATLLAELGIRTVEDLVTYYPYKYVDRSRFYTIREANENLPYIQLKARIVRFEKRGEGRSQRLVATIADGTGTMELVWFKGLKFVTERYRINQPYIIFGKPQRYGRLLNIAHPEIDILIDGAEQKIQGLQAHYNTTEKMKSSFLNSAALHKMIYTALSDPTLQIPETLPDDMVRQFALMPRHDAIHNIHFPKNVQLLEQAQRRLKFEELFFIQLSIIRQTKLREQKYRGYIFGTIGDMFNRFYHECLPFALTGAQKRVLKEIRADLASGKQMNRLLQGDVGSGKTMVALMTALIAVDNGFQACIMAPTEILATQHYQSISEQVAHIGLNVRLLTGSTKRSERETIAAELQNGSLQLLIGTHALIEDNVVFKNLGLVVIDEQHRFGVAQRAKLWAKNIRSPHVLVMTATPIPRTLAMTVYGDLSVSVIDELPPGRKPVYTLHYNILRREQIDNFIQQQIERGRQIYIVFPLIEQQKDKNGNPKPVDKPLADLENGFERICRRFPEYNISMVHGKMKPKEKDMHMQLFAEGKTQILVATTVIEVGVNVPNASVMIIENAERFGLSQLHQLRGRVGRGAEQSYCILLTGLELSKDTRKRMNIMVETNDGFRIAEADMQLRGPGDLEGTQQSGLPFELKIASLVSDGQILELARKAAQEILEDDPELSKPENRMYVNQLNKLKQQTINWSEIS